MGIIYALLARSWYRVDVVMLPVKGGGTSINVGQLGSLAGLVGLDLGSDEESLEAVATLKSKEFIRAFIEDGDLLPVLFAKRWDSEKGAWRTTDARHQPDIRDGVLYFERNIRSISEDKVTGLITLSVRWTDPDLAAQWATALVGRLNEQLRQQAIHEGERNVGFLRSEMEATNLVSLQQSLGKVLESETQRLLLAKNKEEFAFKVVDPAVVPKKPYKPRLVLVAIGSAVMGLLFSMFLVLVRSSWRFWLQLGRST
jgi:uncharacterized protein involved in exopolysaccharide biosynthesis